MLRSRALHHMLKVIVNVLFIGFCTAKWDSATIASAVSCSLLLLLGEFQSWMRQHRGLTESNSARRPWMSWAYSIEEPAVGAEVSFTAESSAVSSLSAPEVMACPT